MTRHLALRCYCLSLVVFLAALSSAKATDVTFIVGDYMPDEGGTWSSDESPLKNPFGVDTDSVGNLYVVELAGGRVHRIGKEGRVDSIAGDGTKSYSGDGGPAGRSTFNGMHNCVVTADDRLLISDSWNHCVREIDLDRMTVDTIIGTGKSGYAGDGGAARDARFEFLMCIELSANKSRLHITDLKNRRIREADLQSGVVTTVAGNGTQGVPDDGSLATMSPLVDPRAAASDSKGNLYVLERGGHALRMVGSEGTIRTVAGTGVKGFLDGPARSSQLAGPKHLCVDSHDRVYIADDLNSAIRRYDPRTGQMTTVLGRGFGDPRIKLSRPHGVRVIDESLYVVDSGNNRILRIPIEP